MELIVNEVLKDLGIVFLVIIGLIAFLVFAIRVWIIFRPIKSNYELEQKYRKQWSYEHLAGYYDEEE